MVSISRSFITGLCVASAIWIITISLCMLLMNFDVMPAAKVKEPQETNESHNSYKRSSYNVNSDALVSKLQPVIRKPEHSLVDNDLSELGLVKTMDDQRHKDEGYEKHAFNVLVSERLSYHRNIPDTRNELCKTVKYSENLPLASIIICFYNEHYHTLLRTIHSIIDRTPASLLKEILLVDDHSDMDNIHENVDGYIKKYLTKQVKLVRTPRREGLIRARLFGARQSIGDVLVFLDSHVEVNAGWIEPLLSRIKDNRTNVVMPVIDIINADTFAYTSSPLVRGGFNWGLHFKWENLPKGLLSSKDDFIKPIKSPTMAGGLFAMDREYFVELGEYDEGMDIWGGENLEISFRIWMCGGQLELIPCSRVGHVFRQRRPYGSPDGKDTMLHNSLRVAYVWMDNYKEHFLNHRTDAKSLDYGDVSSRISLRKKLGCKNFDWYLRHVYPELTLPSDNAERLKKKWSALERDKYQPWHSRKRNYVDQYRIRLAGSSLCLQSSRDDVKTKGSTLTLKSCTKTKHQTWYETDKSELVLAQLLCLQSGKSAPILYKCHEMGGDQEWKHKGESNTPIYNVAAGTCLAAKKKELGAAVTMKLCTVTAKSLISWDIVR